MKIAKLLIFYKFTLCAQVFVNEMEKIEPSLKEMKEVESTLRSQPIAGINTWAKSRLVDCQTQWEKLSKQVSSPDVASAYLLMQLVFHFRMVKR